MAINTSAFRRVAGPLVDYFNEQFEALKGEMRTQSELQAAHTDQVLQASNDRLFDVIVDRDNERGAAVANLERMIDAMRVTVDSLTAEVADLRHELLLLQTVDQQLLAVVAEQQTDTAA